MRVMVFAKATEDSKMDGRPTPEMLEAFAAMDRFTEELANAGVLVAAAGLKNGAQAKRIVCEGPGRTVIDGLPPHAVARRPRGAHPQGGRRPDDGRDRPRLPVERGHDRAASRPREEGDRREATFCSGPVDWTRRAQNSRRRVR